MYDASGSSMRSMVNCRPVPPAAAPTAPASSAAQTSERSPGVPLLLMPLGAKRKTRLPSVYAVRVPGTSHYRRLRSFGAEQGQPTEGKKATVLGRGATRVHRLSVHSPAAVVRNCNAACCGKEACNLTCPATGVRATCATAKEKKMLRNILVF